MANLDNYDWYCDECNARLNNQSGFSADCGTWTCTECGELNYIDEGEILDENEYNDFEESGFDSYNEYVNDRDSSEKISVDDAALIWRSHGKDEDYMFGYTEDELENH